MLRLPGQHLSFLVGFPFCILICTYSVLGSWQYFSVAAETAAAHTHTRKIAKKKNEKKLGKPTNRFRHLRWNIYVAVNGNVNKSWLRKIIDKTREIWSRKTCSKEILLHNCVNSMGEEWIRMFFFYLFFRCQCIFLTGELPKKTLNWSPYGQQRRNQTRALDWAICNHLDGFSFLFFFHSLCPSQQDLFLLIVVVIFFFRSENWIEWSGWSGKLSNKFD